MSHGLLRQRAVAQLQRITEQLGPILRNEIPDLATGDEAALNGYLSAWALMVWADGFALGVGMKPAAAEAVVRDVLTVSE